MWASLTSQRKVGASPYLVDPLSFVLVRVAVPNQSTGRCHHKLPTAV